MWFDKIRANITNQTFVCKEIRICKMKIKTLHYALVILGTQTWIFKFVSKSRLFAVLLASSLGYKMTLYILKMYDCHIAYDNPILNYQSPGMNVFQNESLKVFTVVKFVTAWK